MTSPNASASRRPHVVTALLVGAVVVVLGVASGLGVDDSTSATPVAPVTTVVTRTVPAPSPTRTPVQYVGVGTPVDTPPPVTVVAAAAPTSSSASATSTTAAAAPSTSTAPVPTSTQPVTCSPDLLTGLLDALLGTNGSGLLGGLLGGSGGLGGLSGLLGGSGNGLLGDLLGSTPTSTGGAQDPVGGLFSTLTTTTTLQGTGSSVAQSTPSGLLASVTKVLPTVAKGTAAPTAAQLQPLATACTRQLSSTLPLLSGLR